MNRLTSIRHAVQVVLLLSIGSFNAHAEKVSQQANVLFILADDVGSQTLSRDGNPFFETPHIDALASSGMYFKKGYSNYPTCKPSRAAILSGQYGPRNHIYRVSEKHIGNEEKIKYHVPFDTRNLAVSTISIADKFKEAGYQTAMFGKWHLGANDTSPENHGFDVVIESNNTHFNAKTVPSIELKDDDYIGDVFTKHAINFIDDSVKNNKPFFLFLPYYLIHKPWEAKPDDLAYFEKKGGDSYNQTDKTVAAMAKSLDDNVGRLIQALKARGIDENTLIVFTSDNGGYKMNNNLLNGELRESKGQLYEGGIRVPYIFNWPGKIPALENTKQAVMGIDIFPTLMGLTGIDVAKEHVLDGISISPVLTGQKEKMAARDMFWFYPKWARFNKKQKKWKDEWRNMIISQGYKLIEYIDSNEYELYNLVDDENETTDLIKEMPEKAEQLKKKLAQWKISVDAPTPIINPNYIY
ncbi:sulfatase [Thalassotalea crassostreae]|uniref:sulfatase n=1 Tax=Thalassotalea crassostreae TaxID=1763536 RepID=UPI000838FFE3|nr:sulfatase [Thalassotalea crassostreae]